MSKLVSGRVRKTPQTGITSDRYEFIGLEQAEPDLGDPLVGPSSISANPAPPGTQYILLNIGGNTGKRYWVPSSQLNAGGLTPGSFTVFNNNVQVGLANSFNVFNFVGTGVTVDFVGSAPSSQTGVATVRIQVTDLIAPGNSYEIPYNDPSTGFLRGATGVVFRNNNIGIGSTIPTQKLDVIGNVNISGQIGVNTLSAGFITATNAYFDISTTNISNINNLNVGTSSTIIKTLNGNVGIGSTIPIYKLDVFGSSRYNGLIYDYLGNSGNLGEVLISNGLSTPPTWGVVGQGAPVGIANSIATREAINNQNYYIGFSSTTNSYSSLYVDSNGLIFNPSTVRLGIGTEPSYSLDVSGTIRADQLIVQSLSESPGITTTTSTNTVIIDTFNTNTYRSARYNLQVTTNNQLQLGTNSVSGIISGSNYSPGTYTNVPLISSGIGTGARATINVGFALSIPITQSFGGIFTTSSSIAGIPTGHVVILDKTLVPNAFEQSKLTSIQLTNAGAGFTSVPTITIDPPIIFGNPVTGVGVGSTAIVTNITMSVSNTILSTTGIVTDIVPSISFSAPIGSGSSATGLVGFGISTFSVTGPGTGYSSSPTVTYSQTPTSTPSTRVGLGVSRTNILITPGSNYLSGDTLIVNPVGGIGTGAVISIASLNGGGGITDVDITNVGSGYTVPPTITINTSTGVGAAITITTMIVTDVLVLSNGAGFTTSKPSIGFTGGGGSGAGATVGNIILTGVTISNAGSGYTSLDMPVTSTVTTPGVGTTVGLRISTITATTGLGYTTLPSVSISSPTVSPLTGAVLTPVLGYGSAFNLYSGPGYGGTFAYYISPINSTTFRLNQNISGTNFVNLGYDLTPLPNAYIGGGVTSVSITNSGSGYQIGESLRVLDNNLKNAFIATVGTGFSFSVAGPLIQNFQVSDVMLLQTVGSASTNAFVIEYGGIANQDNLGDYSSDVSGSSARLIFTPTYAHNTIKLTRKGTEL